MAEAQNKYLDIVYDPKIRPFTSYPGKLARHIYDRCGLRQGQTILDLGCGRGEFLKGFIDCGLTGFGADQSDAARSICPGADIRVIDLEQPLPYPNDSFDCVFSKSLIEHFYYPEKIVKEIRRVLRPGGLAITMTPDWDLVYRWFYEDYTHRTPFTAVSLRDIFAIHGFRDVQSEPFLQLPFCWRRPQLKIFARLVAALTPASWRGKSKLVRFAKEGMLFCTAGKPMEETHDRRK